MSSIYRFNYGKKYNFKHYKTIKVPLLVTHKNEIVWGTWDPSPGFFVIINFLTYNRISKISFCFVTHFSGLSVDVLIPGSSMPEARHSMTRRRASPAPRGLLHVAMAFSHINSKGWGQKSKSLFKDWFITQKSYQVIKMCPWATGMRLNLWIL